MCLIQISPELMQIFANGKRRFYSFMQFYVIHSRVKFDQSTTLTQVIFVILFIYIIALDILNLTLLSRGR